jgi:enolase-phosphatase E1
MIYKRNERPRPTAILTDIEGTTTPISFVRDVLYPYAQARLPAFLQAHAEDPEVAAAVAQAATLAEGVPVEQALLQWMETDAKITPLKTLQGLIWEEGYENGDLKGVIYPDVPPVLKSWIGLGIRLFVYSSGSEAAQKLLFGFSDAGNLAPSFGAFFDTRIGPKTAPGSYALIARATFVAPEEFLFLSDVGAELDAAAAAGFRTYQLVRRQDGTVPHPPHPQASSFHGIQAFVG